MNLLIEKFSKQQLAQRQFDGELLMEEFLGPATCSVCGLPKVVVEVEKVPQLEDDKICAGCKNEVATYSSRYNLPIVRAMYELRNLHNDISGAHRAAEVRR